MKSELGQTVTNADKLLTVRQLADRLQVSPNTIYTWEKQGRIKGSYRANNMLRFNVEAVLNSMQTSSSDVKVAPSPSTKSEISTVSASDDRADSVGGTSTALTPLGYSHEHERKETA